MSTKTVTPLKQTNMEEPEQLDFEDSESEFPGGMLLEDQTPEWARATGTTCFFTLILGLFFVYLNFVPLWHTDIWGHLAYGRVIWQTGGVPETEPLLSLAHGTRFVDTAWLSQLIGYGAMEGAGVMAIKALYALLITLCAGLLLWISYRRTQNKLVSLSSMALFLWVDWQQLAIARPQLAGMVCFVALLVYLYRSRCTRKDWILVPILFVVWANLHGSFPVGLGLLACFCVGQAIDVVRRTKRLGSVFSDRRTRHYFILTELAALAGLVNPYGLGLYAEVFTFGSHSNLYEFVEWKPMVLRMIQGQAAAVAAVLLIMTYRLSPRRVRAHEPLLLFGLGAAALWTSRMIVWWAPVAAFCFAPHAAAIWNGFRGRRAEPWFSEPHGRWSVVTIVVFWVSIAITPLSGKLLFGHQVNLTKSLSKHTPVQAAEYLKEHPPQGQTFNVCEYGDYLLWAGPPHMELWAASHVHLIPEEMWKDYMRVINIEAGWDIRLARAGVNTVISQKDDQFFTLNKSVKFNPDWRVAYEDDRSYVFERRKPIE